MAMMIINYISLWYAHEFSSGRLIYITNMRINDFSNDILTVVEINFSSFFSIM